VVAATVANALAPKLLADHPLLLLAFNPLFRYMVATAVVVDPVPFYVVALLAKLSTDPILYVIGWRYGDAAVRWIEKRMGAGEYVRTIERWFVRARYPVVFLAPNRLVCTLAGATRMDPRSFALLNIAGTLLTITVARSLAGVLSGPIGAFVRFTDRYKWWLTAVTVLAVVASVSLRRSQPGVGSIDELQQEAGEEKGESG
jgi:membrane protein DedA with SNARE-associated domain